MSLLGVLLMNVLPRQRHGHRVVTRRGQAPGKIFRQIQYRFMEALVVNSSSRCQDNPRRHVALPVEAQQGALVHHVYHFSVTEYAVPDLSLIHISEPTRLGMISYAVFC